MLIIILADVQRRIAWGNRLRGSLVVQDEEPVLVFFMRRIS